MQNLLKSVVTVMQINLSHNFQLYFSDSYRIAKHIKNVCF